jgi:hypothetical protein
MVTIEQLKVAAEKAGMAKFYVEGKAKEKDDDGKNVPFVIGHDFLERLHAQLEKISVQN